MEDRTNFEGEVAMMCAELDDVVSECTGGEADAENRDPLIVAYKRMFLQAEIELKGIGKCFVEDSLGGEKYFDMWLKYLCVYAEILNVSDYGEFIGNGVDVERK